MGAQCASRFPSWVGRFRHAAARTASLTAIRPVRATQVRGERGLISHPGLDTVSLRSGECEDAGPKDQVIEKTETTRTGTPASVPTLGEPGSSDLAHLGRTSRLRLLLDKDVRFEFYGERSGYNEFRLTQVESISSELKITTSWFDKSARYLFILQLTCDIVNRPKTQQCCVMKRSQCISSIQF